MTLLIDCYNVLHTAMPPMLAGLDVGGLCHALGRTSWARSGGGEIVVVADGVPRVLGTMESPMESVALVFSGGSSKTGGRTADDVIIERIHAHRSPRRVTVVSSDRAIRSAARARRCRSWNSEEFLGRLCGQLRRGSSSTAPIASLGKPSRRSTADRPAVDGLSSEQVEQWMRLMGFEPDDSRTSNIDRVDHPAAGGQVQAPGSPQSPANRQPPRTDITELPAILPSALGIDLHLQEALEQLEGVDMDDLI